MPKRFDYGGQVFEFPDDVGDDEALSFIDQQAGGGGGGGAPKLAAPAAPLEIAGPPKSLAPLPLPTLDSRALRSRIATSTATAEPPRATSGAPDSNFEGLKSTYRALMETVHLSAQGLDELAGTITGRTQGPDEPGGTAPGAAAALLRKASVLSPLALPGHAARAAAALNIPGGKFAKGAVEAVEKAGSTLLTDPTTPLIPANPAVAATFLPSVAESLGTSVGELQAELDKSGWKLTPELGEKLGQTVIGAVFAALLAKGVHEGVRGAAAQGAPPKLEAAVRKLQEPAAALVDAGIPAPENLKIERRSDARLSGLTTSEYVSKFASLTPIEKVAALEALHKQAYTDSLTGIGNRAAFVERLLDPAAPKSRVTWDVEGLKFVNDKLPNGHVAGDALLKAVADVFREAGVGEKNYFRTGGDEFWTLVNNGEEAAQHIAEIKSRLANAEFEVTTPDGTVHRYKGIDIWGAASDHVEGVALDTQIAKAENALKQIREEAVRTGAAPPRGSRPRSLVEVLGEAARGDDVPGGAAAKGAGAGAAIEPREPAAPTAPLVDPANPELGALTLRTPAQPSVPLAGYDQILQARAAAKAVPSLRERLGQALSPLNLKSLLLDENAPIFAKADELAQAMGVPGKFDAETSPIPRDPRLMLPLLKNVGALARHDSIILGRVQSAARREGLLGYVTQYLDLLGGERRLSQAERKLGQLQRESLLHAIGKSAARPVSTALGQESRAFTELGKPLDSEVRVRKSATLEEARYQIGERLARLRSDKAQNPVLAKALAGKFAGAKRSAAALKTQLEGREVHPLFASGKEVAEAFRQFEEALPPEQLQRVQELSAYVLDLHRRNLDLAHRPTSRFGGSANGIISPEQYAELKGRLQGPGGTEYAPLNRILDKVEGSTGWKGGAGLTSQQRTWLREYTSGSKNAPVDPFDAALASSMRLFSDLAHNAAADSILQLGVEGKKAGFASGVRTLKPTEEPTNAEIELRVRKKGKTIRVAAPADFGPALMAKATPELSGLALGTMRKARNLLREGVIQLYPFFAVSNVPVDVSDAMLLGRVHSTKLGKYNPLKYLVGAANWTASLGDTLRESPQYMEALWHGALGATFMHAARAERGAAPLPGAPRSLAGAAREGLEYVGQKTEESTKVFGFTAALKRLEELEAKGNKTANPKELLAAYETMKNVGTPDVLTHGRAIPEANVLFPFLNVGIQGTARMYRRFMRNPKEFLLPMLATVTATEAMILAWNARHKDQEGGLELDHVPQDEKDNYWSIILPESLGRYAENGRLHRLKIRKPQPVRIFAGPIRDVLAGAFTASHPDSGQTIANSLTEAQPVPGLHLDPNKPVSSLASSAAAATNPLARLTLEQIANRDFLRGTPIERRAEEARAPSERYDERTSSTAVVLSQLITKAASFVDQMRGGPLDKEGVPRELLQDVVPGPKRIEHAVRTTTGGLGQLAMGITDPLAAKFSPQPARAREPVERIPILNDLLRRLVTLAPRDSQREKLTDAFYDRYDQLDEIVKTYPVLMRSNAARAQAFLKERGIGDFGEVRGEYVAMVNASSALAKLYQEARAAKTSEEAFEVNKRINELLRTVQRERQRRSAGTNGGRAGLDTAPSTAPMPTPAPGAPGAASNLPPLP